MKKTEKQYYMEKATIGYWSACGGMEVKDIIYGIEDYVIVVVNAWYGQKSIHKLVIRYGENDSYIVFNGRRYRFSECLRA